MLAVFVEHFMFIAYFKYYLVYFVLGQIDHKYWDISDLRHNFCNSGKVVYL